MLRRTTSGRSSEFLSERVLFIRCEISEGRARESLDGFDFPAFDFLDLRLAGANRIAVDQDGTGPALAFAAAELRAGESEVLAENLEQRAPRIGGDAPGFSVHCELQVGIHGFNRG